MQEIRRHQVYRVRERHQSWFRARLRRLLRTLTASHGALFCVAAVADSRASTPILPTGRDYSR
jgi:hypothetical protein